MGFDYDDAIERVISMQTYRNADGTAKTIMVLNGLKYCPFISVVADVCQITIHHLYRLLTYYLGEQILANILEDVGERKEAKVSELKKKEYDTLKQILGL
jgi:hypothetical protein